MNLRQTLAEFACEPLCNVHTHLREDKVGQQVMAPLIRWAMEGGADVLAPMPNTDEGLTTADQVLEYIAYAKRLVLPGQAMTFLPMVMINEETSPGIIDQCVAAGIKDAKFYPKWRTTKSHNGIRHYGRLLPIVKHCGQVGMKCHFHPEHPSADFNNRDAEFGFYPLLDNFLYESNATLIWEHGTDARCIRFWKNMAKSGRFYLTLTPHHLAENEDGAFGDVRSVCKPPLKTREDQEALVALVGEDLPWVMAGPDDAPHDIGAKHPHQGCCACGAWHAPFALALYAHALDGLLQTPEGQTTFVNFTSRHARQLHSLPSASRLIKLVRSPQSIPLRYPVGSWVVQPFWAGREILWQIEQ